MKDISTNIIEIDGKEYTLFLNRKGIVAYERYCIEENKRIEDFQNKYKNLLNKIEEEGSVEISKDTDPFQDLDEIDDMLDDVKFVINKFRKLYWIMLYENHHLSFDEVNELFDKAVEEYGENQLVELGQQMIEEVQENKFEDKELKNLKALKPKK